MSDPHFLRRWAAVTRQIEKGFVFKTLRLLAAMAKSRNHSA
jgi:hypothetical protein